MIEDNRWKIVQIIPAQVGWKAVHCQASTNKHLEISTLSVVCWAVVEKNGGNDEVRTEVRGIEQGATDLAVVEDIIRKNGIGEDGVDRNLYFLGYDDPDAHKESSYWIRQGNNRLTVEKEKRSKAGTKFGADS
ncbi:MAG: hypothetical protein ACREO5_03050 [Candidatus Binatia bacterium]